MCGELFVGVCLGHEHGWILLVAGGAIWVFADLYRKKVIEDAGATWLNMLLISGFVRCNYIYAEAFRVL